MVRFAYTYFLFLVDQTDAVCVCVFTIVAVLNLVNTNLLLIVQFHLFGRFFIAGLFLF